MIRMDTNKNKELIYPELSYTLTGICFVTHNKIGSYGQEKQYGDAIEKLLKETGVRFVREFRIGDSGNIADFIIDAKIVLELKAKRIIIKEDYYQLQRYLQETNVKLGLLLDFRNKYIQPVRVVRIDTENKNRFL